MVLIETVSVESDCYALQNLMFIPMRKKLNSKNEF